MYLIIEHCNGELMDEPFILLDENKLEEYINGEYLIYSLNDLYLNLETDICYMDSVTP